MTQSDAAWRKLRQPHTTQITPGALIPHPTLSFPAPLCHRTAFHRLPRLAHTPYGRRLYVHAYDGFYLGRIHDRLVERLWPLEPSR